MINRAVFTLHCSHCSKPLMTDSATAYIALPAEFKAWCVDPNCTAYRSVFEYFVGDAIEVEVPK